MCFVAGGQKAYSGRLARAALPLHPLVICRSGNSAVHVDCQLLEAVPSSWSAFQPFCGDICGEPKCQIANPLFFLVGVAGFEPATPSSRTMCATRLRYTPRPDGGLIAATFRSCKREWLHLCRISFAFTKVVRKAWDLAIGQRPVQRLYDKLRRRSASRPSTPCCAAVRPCNQTFQRSDRTSHPADRLRTLQSNAFAQSAKLCQRTSGKSLRKAAMSTS